MVLDVKNANQLKRILHDLSDPEKLLDVRHKDGNTALHVALGKNYVHIISQLVAFQHRLCLCTNREQETLICMAAKLGHLEAVKEVIESKKIESKELIESVKERNRCGMNILHLASQVSQVQIVDYLNKLDKVDLSGMVNEGLERPQGDTPKIKPLQWGDTPLHIVARNKNFNMVISLLNILLEY